MCSDGQQPGCEVRHLREVMDERDKRYEQRFQAQERALAERANELGERLELLNELRDDVATKAEIAALDKLVSELKDRFNLREGKSSGVSSTWAVLIAVITLALGIAVYLGGQ